MSRLDAPGKATARWSESVLSRGSAEFGYAGYSKGMAKEWRSSALFSGAWWSGAKQRFCKAMLCEARDWLYIILYCIGRHWNCIA